MIQPGQRVVVSGEAEPIAPGPPAREHEVGPGETLSTIARMHGLSIDELRSLNSMSPGQTLIRPGDKLLVGGNTGKPGAARDAVHVVRRGETLMRIATSYGVRLADLLHINRLDSRTVIHPGQRIVIPFLPR